MTEHGFCTLHRIAYNRSLDATCPQCGFAHTKAEQLDYDPRAITQTQVAVGAPLDAAGKPVDLATLKAR